MMYGIVAFAVSEIQCFSNSPWYLNQNGSISRNSSINIHGLTGKFRKPQVTLDIVFQMSLECTFNLICGIILISCPG